MEILCLCFRLDAEWYLHDVSSVREVIPYQEPSPVPGNAPNNLGILNIRGNVISVFSGRSLLSLPTEEDFTQCKVIVFHTEQGNYGVLVDEVAEIISVDSTQIDQPVGGGARSTIQGTFTYNGRPLILLDLAQCDAINLNA